MAVIVVDFENVHEQGLRGIDMLNQDDKLDIFYSKTCDYIRGDEYERIEATNCEFRAIRLLQCGKDFLDKYIATAVGEWYKSGEKEIAIISKDKGYQAILDYYKATEVEDLHIIKASSVEQALILLKNPADRERRAILSSRARHVNLDEIRIRAKERDKIRAEIRKVLDDTAFWYQVQEVCDLINENKGNKKMVYTRALHNFGRDNGRAIYNKIKEIV